MIKCLHAADWHCRDDDLDEAKKCLEFLVKTAKDQQPDIIVIAGDIFNSRHVKLESESAKLVFDVIFELANLSPIAIVIGTPSHEGTTVEALKYIRAKYPVWVSTTPEQIYLCEGDLNSDISKLFAPDQAPIDAVITLIPPPTKQYFQSMSSIDNSNKEISDAMTAMFAGFGAKAAEFSCPHILGGHLSIGGAFVSDSQQLIGVDVEVSTDQLSLANATVNALGHIHYGQKIGDRSFYSGSLYRVNSGEDEDKGFWIHELSANGLQDSTFIQTPSRRFFKIKHDFTDTQDDFKVPLTQEILEQVKGAIVKIEIRAYEDDVKKIDRDALKQDMAEAVSYSIKIDNVPRVNVRSEAILKMTRLRDKIVERARLVGETVPESILFKADRLEVESMDEIVDGVAACLSEEPQND